MSRLLNLFEQADVTMLHRWAENRQPTCSDKLGGCVMMGE
jgi:hypothetical protein